MLTTIYTFLFFLSGETVLGLTIKQSALSWTKTTEKSISIKCEVDGVTGSLVPDGNHPERDDFTVTKGSYDLRVKELKKSHSAVYYCASWMGGVKVFGSGTRLYVEAAAPVGPKLSAYSVLKPNNGKSILACQARDMFPNLVRFTWNDQSDTEVTLSEKYDLLEQKDEEEARVTSMLIIDQQKASSASYTCSVQHEDKHNKIKISAEPLKGSDSDTVQPCPPQVDEQKHGASELMHRLYLFNLTYVSLLVKNVLYFCAVGLLLYKRRVENNKTFSKTSPTSNQDK
ncbi:hypothetical protein AOLI_G00112770 [Acnodon oligacanthus]